MLTLGVYCDIFEIDRNITAQHCTYNNCDGYFVPSGAVEYTNVKLHCMRFYALNVMCQTHRAFGMLDCLSFHLRFLTIISRSIEGMGTNSACCWCILATFKTDYIEGLVQESRNSSALAMELRLSCTKPSIYNFVHALFIFLKIHNFTSWNEENMRSLSNILWTHEMNSIRINIMTYADHLRVLLFSILEVNFNYRNRSLS